MQINNKYNFNQHVKYRIWEPFAQKYNEYSGHIVGINYISMQNRITIMYGIIEDIKWTNEDEIKLLSVHSNYEYYMKYCLNTDINSNVAVQWVEENDILE